MRTNLRVGALLFYNNYLVTTKMTKKDHSYQVLPGGGVEENETVTEALIRELQEELNVNVTKFRLVYLRELTNKDLGRGVEFYFYIEEYDGTPTKGIDPEQKEAHFEKIELIELSALKDYTFHPAQLIAFLETDKALNFPEIRHLGLHEYP